MKRNKPEIFNLPGTTPPLNSPKRIGGANGAGGCCTFSLPKLLKSKTKNIPPSPVGLADSLWRIQRGNQFLVSHTFYILFLLLFLYPVSISAQKTKTPKPIPPIFYKDGKLNYTADSLGNRIPDFSYCGYMAGEQSIPDIPIKIYVPQNDNDQTFNIQNAIDYVSSLPADKNGFRGAILLGKGIYQVAGQLKISKSGVVVRGSGMGKEGTLLIGNGLDRQTLIVITGKNNRKVEKEITIENNYIPVNGIQFDVSDPQNFKTGDVVIIHRPATQEWINALGTNHFGGGITALGWKPGDQDIFWDRKITAISGKTVTLDAPLTTAIDKNFGGGTIAKYDWPGRISQVGIENLRLVSTYDTLNSKDENHRWMAITIENTSDAWVRQVVFENFAGSAVAIWETSKRVTVEDCKSLHPVSEIGGQRRNTFWATGQQTLFQRLYSEFGIHDFAVGYRAPGPNAFVQCEAYLPFSFSGGIDSWASGTLFDVVYIDGNAISYKNLGQELQGAGWNTANSVLWNCSASRVDCYKPPTANNWAFGTWAQFSGDGYWGESNNSIEPRSLYYAQLTERLGESIKDRTFLLEVESEASSSPSVEVAQQLTALAEKPRMQLSEFIDRANQRQSIPTDKTAAKISQPVISTEKPGIVSTQIQNGWLVNGSGILTGSRLNSPWWNWNLHEKGLKNANPAITRFVPGRSGTGFTDNLSDLTDSMVKNHISVFQQNYALWYDRRRDDHERIRRIDGDVWPPFYELPFARTGLRTAWDGLSLYDLTKYNHWYWSRLKQFANLGESKGLVLINHHYFQHNIIEAGAHWADFPWRPVNNINNTGFPEPVPYAGDKRIFMAKQFYDTAHAIRNPLHKAFIRQNLNNFANNSNVIHFVSAEYTGPFHFVRFWLQTIRNWEQETGNNAIVGLSVTKDVQDSVLNNPKLSTIIDLIDIRYWAYKDDGSAYAPQGGQNLAPRQHARLVKPGKRSFEQTYRAIREYRDKFPEKAVMYSEDGWDRFGWAIFMAGGSLANIPVIEDKKFLLEAVNMKPTVLPELTTRQYALANPGKGYIVYSNSGDNVKLDLSQYNSSFTLRWINPENGKFIGKEEKIEGGRMVELKCLEKGAVVGWVSSN